ncbi:MAG TPA: ABC transporter permease [Desulfobacteraceae bacterium]|nr:ABC transporter permease [Desulfobacteraceae bacterium]
MHLDARSRLFHDPWFAAGISISTLLAVMLILGPVFSPHDPYDISFVPLSPPSPQHWLGVNDGGMDILSELFSGLRNTVFFGLTAAAAALTLGTLVGLFSAAAGGVIDRGLMRAADIFLAVPAVMVLILVAAFFRPSPIALALTLASLGWARTSKVIRAQARVVNGSLHVKAARRMGGTRFYLVGRHLMPELFPLYLIGFAAQLRMAVFMEASLSFLGLFDPTRKSLGIMINYALKYYYMDIWMNWLLPPVVCLTLLIMTSTFLAVSLEKVFDPRLKEAA